MQRDKYLIVLAGATGSGKTELSIRLAKSLQTVIISADSRQFYREMAIGTAKPTPEETNEIKHYFTDSHSIHEPLSVGGFEQSASQLLEELFETHQTVLLVGGSGLYIQALCEGLDEFPAVSPRVRTEVENKLKQYGIERLQEELKQKDPTYFETVDLHNPHRLIRAISIIRSSGQPFSSFLNQKKKPRPFRVLYLCLQRNRVELYDRINQRVDKMMEMGLLDEVKSLVNLKHLQALQTVGYQELFNYLSGEHSLETGIELIKRNSRRYAKRQMTWFRRNPQWFYFGSNQLIHVQHYLRLFITEGIHLKKGEVTELEAIQAFYTGCGYQKRIDPDNQLFTARQNGEIIGAVRLCMEQKIQVLRGCYVHRDHHKKGIGSLLLLQLEQQLIDRPLYTIANKNLAAFYQSISLRPIESNKAPMHLQERLQTYAHPDLCIYHKPTTI